MMVIAAILVVIGRWSCIKSNKFLYMIVGNTTSIATLVLMLTQRLTTGCDYEYSPLRSCEDCIRDYTRWLTDGLDCFKVVQSCPSYLGFQCE